MDIQYLTSEDQARFAELLHENDAELTQIFAQLMVQMEVDTDYDTVMLSFVGDYRLRVAVEDSPYIIVIDEDAQDITLLTSDDYNHEVEDFVEQCDFDEDGVATVVDIMASRILSDENDGFQ